MLASDVLASYRAEALIGAFSLASENVVIDPHILNLDPGMDARCKSTNSYKICTDEVSLHLRHEETRYIAKGTCRFPKIVRFS